MEHFLNILSLGQYNLKPTNKPNKFPIAAALLSPINDNGSIAINNDSQVNNDINRLFFDSGSDITNKSKQ